MATDRVAPAPGTNYRMLCEGYAQHLACSATLQLSHHQLRDTMIMQLRLEDSRRQYSQYAFTSVFIRYAPLSEMYIYLMWSVTNPRTVSLIDLNPRYEQLHPSDGSMAKLPSALDDCLLLHIDGLHEYLTVQRTGDREFSSEMQLLNDEGVSIINQKHLLPAKEGVTYERPATGWRR